MNSINQQQAERNHEDLTGTRAVERIKETVAKAQTCFFCSAGPVVSGEGIRPMNVRKVDEQGTLWFLSADDSHKNQEIARNPSVVLLFQGSPHSDFLQLSGHASISRDQEKIEELWEPVLKTWFTGGVQDPRITVIKVTPREGYYWDNKHGNLVAGVKMMIGAMVGKTMDDSIEGQLKP